MRRSSMPRALVIGAPAVMLLLGAGAGWLTRTQTSAPSTTGPIATVVGGSLPSALDEVAPVQPLPRTFQPGVVDPSAVIGLDTSGRLSVPAGAAIDLPLSAGGAATAVDPQSKEPITPQGLPAIAPVEPVLTNQLPDLAATPSTLAPKENERSAPANSIGPTTFVDRCAATPGACAGERGEITATTADQRTPASLRVSTPVAAAAGYADLCDTVEAGAVPDTFLTPATRPTIAVFLNQPSTVAISGTWGDGTPLAKTTMVTLPAYDDEWQQAWQQQHDQRTLVACITLPLDDVRSHASGGVATLKADVLALSASGRAESTGLLTLNIPTDGDDPLFVDRLTIADHGEQLLADGVLYPTVHVHYAFLDNAVVPTGSGLDPAKVRVFDRHAFVEGADCNGWAANQQGRDRTVGGDYRVHTEQRTVTGRQRDVTVVDGDVYLDPTMPGGWEGQFCVRLTATDGVVAKVFTLALQGVTARSPRAADYDISVLLGDPELAPDLHLSVTFATPTGAVVCNGASLANGAQTSATCTTRAHLVANGIDLALRLVDGAGAQHPLLGVRVPVNTGYCDPDDPFASVGDGCSTGFNQPYLLSLDDGTTVRVVVQVNRAAVAGTVAQDPSGSWRLGPTTAFAG